MQLSRGRLYLLAGLAIIYASYLPWYHYPHPAGHSLAPAWTR